MEETVMLSRSRRDSPSSIRLLYCCTKSVPETEPEAKVGNSANAQKKAGGWKAMPFILGNETFERLATFGLLANFTVYLMREFHMSPVSASNVISIWFGISNFAPLVGAFISDAYVGRFKTIAFASFASLLGMLTLTMTAWVPALHPPKCRPGDHPQRGQCVGPNATQLGVLLTGLGLLTIGTGGIRPCSIPFGVDQFDATTDEGIRGINSFFNWYYMTFTVVVLISLTLVVYIQDSISWVLGFGIPTVLMACSIVLFLIGTRIYVYVKPEGSIFSAIVQVLVTAYKKRNLKLPVEGEENGVYYDPPLMKEIVLSKLPLTNQFRFLNKAAVVMEDDLQPGVSRDKWRLSSIQEVEEVKCIIKIIPIWAAGIISFTSMVQQVTFTVQQALKMDRHLGPKFQIPAASITIVSMITIGLWLPFYDRIIVPSLQRITKKESGITVLQRTGVGIFFSIVAMLVAGVIERKRKATALLHPNPLGIAPISVMWLAPQLILMGFCEAFSAIGQIELFNKEFPEHMRSIGNSLFFCSFAGASYLSTLVVNVVHGVTGGHGRPGWLANDINTGNLDYFYYLLAGMGVINFVYFVYFADRYRYKGTVQPMEKTSLDVERSPIRQ